MTIISQSYVMLKKETGEEFARKALLENLRINQNSSKVEPPETERRVVPRSLKVEPPNGENSIRRRAPSSLNNSPKVEPPIRKQFS